MESTVYNLIDTHTGRIIKSYPYSQRNAARRRRDKLDLAYGAVRYQVVPVFDRSPETLKRSTKLLLTVARYNRDLLLIAEARRLMADKLRERRRYWGHAEARRAYRTSLGPI